MSSALESPQVRATSPTFSVRQDASRAELLIGDRLDADAATLVAVAVCAHLDAGRRYFRLALDHDPALEEPAAEVLSKATSQGPDRTGVMSAGAPPRPGARR